MLLLSGCTDFAMLMASSVLSAARILLSEIVFAALSAGAVTCAAEVASAMWRWNGAWTNRSPEKRRWRAGLGSEGVGQDKRPHIAARSVGCFCWPYFALRQGGAWARNVRLTINAFRGSILTLGSS